MLDMLPEKGNGRWKVRKLVCETSEKTVGQPANLKTSTYGKQLESQQPSDKTGRQTENRQTGDKTARQPTNKQTSNKTGRQAANHLKYAIKSKSLDVFDRPNRKLHLTRFMSLSTMSSIPEDSCSSTWAHSILTEDDMVISHRSPVSIHNGYRAAWKTGQYSKQSTKINIILHFQIFLNPPLLKTI